MTESRGVRQNIEAEAKRIEEDTLYTFKQLYEAAASERKRHYWVGSAAAVLSMLAGASVVAKPPWWQVAAPLISFFVTALTAWMTFVKPAERAQEYKNAACDFQQLRDDTRVFRELDLPRPNVDEELLVERIRVLSARRAELRKDGPQPPDWAYLKAQAGIARGESEYAVDSAQPSLGSDGLSGKQSP